MTALDGNFSLYINGELEGFSSHPNFVPMDGTGDLILGGYSINSSAPFIGQVDELRIHDRAFFEKGVSTLYKLESSLPNGYLTTDHLSSALSDLLDGNGVLKMPAGSVIARLPMIVLPVGIPFLNV